MSHFVITLVFILQFEAFLSSTFIHRFLFLTILFHLILQRSIYVLLLRGVNRKYSISSDLRWHQLQNILVFYMPLRKEKKKSLCVKPRYPISWKMNTNYKSIKMWAKKVHFRIDEMLCNLILSLFTLTISTTGERNSLYWGEG